jgi:hypothetical protein
MTGSVKAITKSLQQLTKQRELSIMTSYGDKLVSDATARGAVPPLPLSIIAVVHARLSQTAPIILGELPNKAERFRRLSLATSDESIDESVGCVTSIREVEQ